MTNLKFPCNQDPKSRIEFIFQHEMKPCPKCRSYNLRAQTPIDIKDPTHERMLGYVYLKCFDCGHKGPSVNIGNMTRSQVGKSEELYKFMIDAWNSQLE